MYSDIVDTPATPFITNSTAVTSTNVPAITTLISHAALYQPAYLWNPEQDIQCLLIHQSDPMLHTDKQYSFSAYTIYAQKGWFWSYTVYTLHKNLHKYMHVTRICIQIIIRISCQMSFESCNWCRPAVVTTMTKTWVRESMMCESRLPPKGIYEQDKIVWKTDGYTDGLTCWQTNGRHTDKAATTCSYFREYKKYQK